MTDTPDIKMYPKDFNIYKASHKDPTKGALLSFRLHKCTTNIEPDGSYKIKDGSIKLTLIRQTGPLEFKGERVTLKLNLLEIVQFIQAIRNHTEVNLYHKYKNKDNFECNSTLKLKFDIKGDVVYGGVSVYNTTEAGTANVSCSLNVVDLESIIILFTAAIPLIQGWC